MGDISKNKSRWLALDKIMSRLSITKKMLLIYFTCAIFPLMIQTIVYNWTTEKNIQQDMLKKLTMALEEKAEKINNELTGIVVLSKKLSKEEKLNRVLNINYYTDFSYYSMYQEYIKGMVQSYLPFYKQVQKITIYSNNRTIFNGAYVMKIDTMDMEMLEEDLSYVKLERINETEYWLRRAVKKRVLEPTEDRSLSILCNMDLYQQYTSYSKILRIDLHIPYFTSILSDHNLFETILLVDSEGNILMSDHYYASNGEFLKYSSSNMEDGVIVIEKKLKDFELVLYGYYNSNLISKQFSVSNTRTMIVFLFGILFSTFFIVIVAGNITKGTKLLVRQSEQIALGNFIQVNYSGLGRDEITRLIKAMNQMSSKLKDLIENEYQAKLIQTKLEKETTQAKLLALKSQVNPHFLFNALESIRLKAVAKGEGETAKMIKYMSRMFRHLIQWEDDIITLEDDMNFLKEFLSIQKYRFDDEFCYEITMDDKSRKCLLPKLIIQPIVENSCIHGVEAIVNNRKVRIDAKVEADFLILQIEDNGRGMSQNRLEEVKEIIRGEKTSNSVGLYNVYQRLHLYYGERCDFHIESTLETGTTFIIKIPKMYREGEGDFV